MNSLDTNILVYAVNRGCQEFESAHAIYQKMLDEPAQWIISDQVLYEFYRALRHPKILEKPLSHTQALAQITFLREESGVRHCGYDTSFWDKIKDFGSHKRPKAIHIFDRILAITLINNGVENLYTRNTKDFKEFNFKNLINPITF